MKSSITGVLEHAAPTLFPVWSSYSLGHRSSRGPVSLTLVPGVSHTHGFGACETPRLRVQAKVHSHVKCSHIDEPKCSCWIKIFIYTKLQRIQGKIWRMRFKKIEIEKLASEFSTSKDTQSRGVYCSRHSTSIYTLSEPCQLQHNTHL